MSRRQLLEIAVAVALGAQVVRGAFGWLKRKRGQRRPSAQELEVVSDSAKLIAAWRVVESQELEGLRLFYDPFAGVLASEAAVAAALRQAQPITNQDGSAGGGIGRRYKVSTISTRVWWFDRQIVEALQPPSPSASASDGTPKGAAAAPVPRQVVLLGAGMDTRPWRLDDLPKGVAWFEVDRAEVPGAKRRTLVQQGAQLVPGTPGATHPLRVASWELVEADLLQADWVAALKAAGFNPSEPTVWVAEGLLMYLTYSEVETLLHQLAGASAPGSLFLAQNLTHAVLESLKHHLAHPEVQEQGSQDQQDKAEPGTEDYPPTPALGGDRVAPGVETRAGAHATAQVGTPQDGKLTAGLLAVGGKELAATWLSAFPPDPADLFGPAGWRLETATTRARIAEGIGRLLGAGSNLADVVAYPTQPDVPEDRSVLFVAARR